MKQLLLYAFLILIPVSGVAQQLRELNVTPADKPATIPVFREHPDEAAIIINSSLTNLQFGSNVGIVNELHRPNEGVYILIIYPWRQTISVTAPGYRQARFTVAATQPREVVYYDAEPVEDTRSTDVFVRFMISPSDASVFVNDQEVDVSRSVPLELGSHNILIEKPGYRTIEEEIKITSMEDNFLQYELSEVELQAVEIRTTPSDAQVFIDNADVGRSDYANFHFPGEYFVRIVKSEYKTIETMITVSEEGDNRFDFELERFAGQLNLNVTPPNARVYINRASYTGQNNIDLSPGMYSLEISLEGYQEYSERIEIVENEQLYRNISLEPKTGNLRFTVRPIDAQVELRNSRGEIVDRWSGIKQISDLQVGRYEFTATHADYQSLTDQFVIDEDKTTNLSPVLIAFSQIELEEMAERQRQQAEALRRQQEREEAKLSEEQKEKRRGIIRYPNFDGFSLYYSSLTLDANNFENNVEQEFSFGFGFFQHWGFLSNEMGFYYNNFLLAESTHTQLDIYETIHGITISNALSPSLALGPFIFSWGLGIEYTQYIAENDQDFFYHYTISPFTIKRILFSPKNWGVAFTASFENSFYNQLSEPVADWNRANYSIIFKF